MSSPAVHALFPGTFDPPTLGHVDVLRRACRLFARVTVGVAEHPSKEPVLSVADRLALLARLAEPLGTVQVVPIEGLTVDACRAHGATAIVRGVRSGTDFDYEVQMARTNRQLATSIDTVLLVPDPPFAHITSTLVRQIARMGGDLGGLVPAEVDAALRARFDA